MKKEEIIKNLKERQHREIDMVDLWCDIGVEPLMSDLFVE